MKTAVDYLRAALKDLRASRAELDRQITILEETLEEVEPGSGLASSLIQPGSQGGPTVREIALGLAEDRGVVTPNDVVNAAHEVGNMAKYESVSSILSRLHKEGVLEKGDKRGTYRLPPTTQDVIPNIGWRKPSPGPEQLPDGDGLGASDDLDSSDGELSPGTIVR